MAPSVVPFSLIVVLATTSYAGVGPEADQAAPAKMRFQAMDRNGDGAVARDEWRGSGR